MKLPSSIREINALPEEEKYSIYQLLLPDWIYSTYNIDKGSLTNKGGKVVKFRCPNGSRAVEIFAKGKSHYPTIELFDTHCRR